MRLLSTVEISCPPEGVFPWIGNPSKAREWQKNIRSEKILAGKPGMIGTRFVETIEEGGRELETTGIVTRYEPERLIAFHLTSRVHELDVSYSLKPIGHTTRVTIEADVRWKFPVSVISLFAGMSIQRRMADQSSSELSELKRICEGGPRETNAPV